MLPETRKLVNGLLEDANDAADEGAHHNEIVYLLRAIVTILCDGPD